MSFIKFESILMCENLLKTDTIEISGNETKESKSWKWSHFELTTVNKSEKLKCKNCSKIYSTKTRHNALKLHQKTTSKSA